MAVGGLHACALLLDGTVKCWGHGGYGELGNGTFTFSSSVPVDAPMATTATATLGVVQTTISVSDVDVLEGNSGTRTASFPVTLSANPASPVTVQVATANGTATAGSDYLAVAPNTLTWNPGDPLTKSVSVTVRGDTLREGNETFLLKLSSPSGAALADSQATGTIIDEEGRFFA